ncbi:RHS repeat-associated core domain-containing protein [Paenactinomyces guangxiensis]|uniref:Colicin D C-terminal domain-containing protein n=1 Tax=Paenactinomyces guangxiensis TaxID=1490290 RepID=A0A7W1WSZ0_9BACL|nr:RHS repeat-associated core domain-containing protein [Paenactinomyces guangxiensis]MBA4495505.1 hypothetical protein [Paenactinomyces guangxiensis]
MISEEVMDVMTRSYVYSSWGERMAMIKTDAAGTSYYQYNTDIDVEMLLDEQGNIRATYGYTPYGENDDAMFTGADEPDPAQPDKEVYNPFRYGGKRWDPYTESYDLGFRNYFPGVGRFMSPDSYTDSEQHKGLFMDAMTNSLYSFTDGNPVSYVDLDGHVPLGGDDACMRAPVSCYTANTGYYYDPAGPKRKASPKAMKRAKRTLDTLRKKPVHNKNKGEQPPPRPKPKPVPINTFVYAKAGGYGYAAAPAYGREPLSPEAQLWVGGILFALAVIDPLPGDEALVAGALGYAGFRMKSIINSVTGKGTVASKPVIRLSNEGIDYALSNQSRLQHSFKHAKDLGFGNWNKQTSTEWKNYIRNVLENPSKSFDNVLGRDKVKGFYKEVDGNNVAVYIYKDGKYQGQVATVVRLNQNQLSKFGLK